MMGKMKMNNINSLKKKIYYAQNREDLIIEAFFLNKKAGFYVDIGAYDPDIDSVTKRFYLKGWTGINIEPQEDRIKTFNRKRKKDINLQIGVSDKNTKMNLRIFGNQGLSTFSEEMKKNYSKQREANSYDFDYTKEGTSNFKDVEVSVKTLKTIFTEKNVKHIDFMKIDVEGFEYEVLSGNDWQKFRPKLLCIESDNMITDWRNFLSKNEYKIIFNDGLNDYYYDNRLNKDPKFEYINHVLLEMEGGIRREHFEIANNYHNQLKAKILENSDLALRVEDVNMRLMSLNKHTEEQHASFWWAWSLTRKLFKERLKGKLGVK